VTSAMRRIGAVLLCCGLILPGYAASLTAATRVTCVWGGARETIALKSDGTVWAWGNNPVGELGNGNTICQATPVQVLGPGGELGVPGKPLSVQQQFDLTGAGDRNTKPPYCTNSNVPVPVQWP
jgi:hypothetical protein